MKRAAALAALAACGLMGCGTQVPPRPRVLSIDPNTMTSSSFADVIISVDAVLPFTVDYGAGKAAVDPLILLSVDPIPVGGGTFEPNGRLSARIPSKLTEGAHDVTVTLVGAEGDSRTGVLAGGFIVTPGTWPSGGFAIAPIADPQRVDVYFTLTITAQGANASSFNGTLDYVIPGVTPKPVTTGPFTNGVYQESLSIHSPTMGQKLQVTAYDLLGRLATSNSFSVNP
ncbi:MAG TPA: hypothetical protein VFA20_10755 [Myxococcaceae bacterium]|nr:hypothetical protein [Myxococcaceae bacterium]